MSYPESLPSQHITDLSTINNELLLEHINELATAKNTLVDVLRDERIKGHDNTILLEHINELTAAKKTLAETLEQVTRAGIKASEERDKLREEVKDTKRLLKNCEDGITYMEIKRDEVTETNKQHLQTIKELKDEMDGHIKNAKDLQTHIEYLKNTSVQFKRSCDVERKEFNEHVDKILLENTAYKGTIDDLTKERDSLKQQVHHLSKGVSTRYKNVATFDEERMARSELQIKSLYMAVTALQKDVNQLITRPITSS